MEGRAIKSRSWKTFLSIRSSCSLLKGLRDVASPSRLLFYWTLQLHWRLSGNAMMMILPQSSSVSYFPFHHWSCSWLSKKKRKKIPWSREERTKCVFFHFRETDRETWDKIITHSVRLTVSVFYLKSAKECINFKVEKREGAWKDVKEDMNERRAWKRGMTSWKVFCKYFRDHRHFLSLDVYEWCSLSIPTFDSRCFLFMSSLHSFLCISFAFKFTDWRHHLQEWEVSNDLHKMGQKGS